MDGIPGVPMLEGVQNASRITLTEKKCTKCKVIKPLNEFTITKRKDTNRPKVISACKECYRKMRREWVKKPENRKIQNERLQKAVEKIKSLWMQIYIEHGLTQCSICGYNRSFNAIELHHIKPKDKKIYNIREMIRRKPNNSTIKELKKCIALCANCHREIHDKLRKEEIENGRE